MRTAAVRNVHHVVMCKTYLERKAVIKFCIFLFAILMLAGCVSGKSRQSNFVPAHTLLWVGSPTRQIWSEEPVVSLTGPDGVRKMNAYPEQELSPGERATLANGVVITYDGTTLVVNNVTVDSFNAIIEHDGTVSKNAMIRTFK